ncbi:MAG: hypothetical protein HKM07_07665 [Chlamydiae bacterium]|nr:hypothetical protein [Chlamydiota bacterium]
MTEFCKKMVKLLNIKKVSWKVLKILSYFLMFWGSVETLISFFADRKNEQLHHKLEVETHKTKLGSNHIYEVYPEVLNKFKVVEEEFFSLFTPINTVECIKKSSPYLNKKTQNGLIINEAARIQQQAKHIFEVYKEAKRALAANQIFFSSKVNEIGKVLVTTIDMSLNTEFFYSMLTDSSLNEFVASKREFTFFHLYIEILISLLEEAMREEMRV